MRERVKTLLDKGWSRQRVARELGVDSSINGDGDDNRLENLQLLCGNCHSQTDNWGGRGVRRRAVSADEAVPA